MPCTYSDEKPWKKVKILRDRPADVPLEQLYHTPLVSAQAKVPDLKKMARDYNPSPERGFYLELPIKVKMEQKQKMKTVTS